MRELNHKLRFDRDENAGVATALHAVCTRWFRAAHGVDTTLAQLCGERCRALACSRRARWAHLARVA